MTPEFDLILDECLAEMAAGQPVEAVLSRYPQQAAELRPLLEMAAAVHESPAPQARVSAVNNGRQQMLTAVSRQFPNPPVSKSIFSRYAERIQTFITRKENLEMNLVIRYAVVTFLATLFVGGGSAAAASARAVPGDALYPVKIAVEETRLNLTQAEKRAQLEHQYEEERREEVHTLIEQQRTEDVRFSGEAAEIAANQWVVGGVVVTVDRDTQIQGHPVVGVTVTVSATTEKGGIVRAHTITVAAGAPDERQSHPTPWPTHTPAAARDRALEEATEAVDFAATQAAEAANYAATQAAEAAIEAANAEATRAAEHAATQAAESANYAATQAAESANYAATQAAEAATQTAPPAPTAPPVMPPMPTPLPLPALPGFGG